MTLRFDEWALKTAMAEKRIRNLRELADKVSISHGYARSMARGLIPGEEVRDRIASALGVDAAEIWHP